MMSPLSIATFLPPGRVEFDLVIFDEASQVKPVDAFGAILRGKQLVVVGDTRQLPPTTFFDSAIDADDDESELVTSDLESILGLCYLQGMPSRMLRWHYRSRHESLITVSNHEFYEDKLVIFPSPDLGKAEVGLVFHHLPDTVYGRAKSRANLKEASRVAEAVMQHARTKPDQSLGVAAFSSSQMRAILDQLEILRRQDLSCEGFFRSHPNEPFFVKNLENVQGDERDAIFISVGYGRTAEGLISMNFGPLNRQGGERRLNVLITRARRRCEVFTNLTADDIDLRRSNAWGVRALKRYLEYAQTGNLHLPVTTQAEPESPFEEAVAAELRRLGYQVECQVGSAGFSIDLAIIDEDRPGRYVLGIECDGASYHSAQSARDRDRLRQGVLENLGWTIHRVWSTDWFQNQRRELARLVNSIEVAKAHMGTRSASRVAAQAAIAQSTARPIERIKAPNQRKAAFSVQPYRMAKLRVAPLHCELHEVPRDRMTRWIRLVVDVESPMHKEELARRIAGATGVKRIGHRIQCAFDIAVAYAVKKRMIAKRGPFLWTRGEKELTLRRRGSLPPVARKIEYIAPEELALAVTEAVTASFGMRRENIPPEVCRVLGFRRISEGMRKYVDALVNKMVKQGHLVSQGEYLVVAPE